MSLPYTADALPVFPLPDVVLMPGELLPLHIFEPRYRELLAYALEHDRHLGLGTLVPGGHGAIYPEVGVGAIVRHEPLADGRSNIVLEQVGATRVVEECVQEHPFRRFQVAPVDEAPADAADVEGCRALLFQLAASTAGLSPRAVKIAELEGMELVHAIARRLYQTGAQRRQYLGATDRQRARLVAGDLAGFLATRPAVAEG